MATKPANDPSNKFNTQTGKANPNYRGDAARPANDPSNKFNTVTGKPNPNYKGDAAKPANDPSNEFNTVTGKPNPNYKPGSIIQPKPAGMSAADRAELQKIIDNPNLTADQRVAIQAISSAITSGDKDRVLRIKAAMSSAMQFSNPYFKAQVRMAIDALERSTQSQEGNLAFQKAQKERTIQDLDATSEYLTLEQANEVKQLTNKYQTDIATLDDSMAASGFTASSRRTRSDQILKEQSQGLIESSGRTLGYKQANINLQVTDTQAQIANLQRLAAEGKLESLRDTEKEVGTTALSSLGYSDLLPGGGVGGTLPRQQVQDAISYASNPNFVF